MFDTTVCVIGIVLSIVAAYFGWWFENAPEKGKKATDVVLDEEKKTEE